MCSHFAMLLGAELHRERSNQKLRYVCKTVLDAVWHTCSQLVQDSHSVCSSSEDDSALGDAEPASSHGQGQDSAPHVRVKSAASVVARIKVLS